MDGNGLVDAVGWSVGGGFLVEERGGWVLGLGMGLFCEGDREIDASNGFEWRDVGVDGIGGGGRISDSCITAHDFINQLPANRRMRLVDAGTFSICGS